MEKRGTDKIEDLGVAETPEDVAVLYSWANLHGAKYRDFSASRREYRAQLRHRAAEQVRQQALIAQAEAEAAADAADATARKASDAARLEPGIKSDSSIKRNLRNAEEAVRTAAAERVEAARRAEAAAMAEAAARREEREIADAHASAERQAARYAESELRRRDAARGYMTETQNQIPGEITDPYTPQPSPQMQGSYAETVRYQAAPAQETFQHQERQQPQQPASYISARQPAPVPPQPYTPAPQAQVVDTLSGRGESSSSQRRRQGYHPDEASGVRQIYRGPEYDAPQPERRTTDSGRFAAPSQPRAESQVPRERRAPAPEQPPMSRSDSGNTPPSGTPGSSGAGAASSGSGVAGSSSGGRHPFNAQATPRQEVVRADVVRAEPLPASANQIRPTISPGSPVRNTPPSRPLDPAPIAPFWEHSRPVERAGIEFDPGYAASREPSPGSASAMYPVAQQPMARPEPVSAPRAVSPFSQSPVAGDPARGRRAQDDFNSDRAAGFPEPQRPGIGTQPSYFGAQQLPPSSQPRTSSSLTDESSPNTPFSADPAGPAWFYAPAASEPQPQFNNPVPLPSVAETLQHSRERVAARWYALKGVFEQPGESVEQTPVRQKEIRTPVLAVFSLAGGVGKTSLVATIGRSLSSLGEKVLLTDTTSHGLLPFYFGASELRQGTVRTFSPPSGSTDAPIYLVNYEVPTEKAEPEKEKLVEEILNNNRGTHRIMLDLTVNSAWIIRHMARMSPTVLVPLAPDMNSVISLQAIEKFFQGMVDADGRPLQPYYLINQFDVSLPLHLDVREVLRRQLGDRLLPFVIHRAPEVSEALAEGMTVVDYAPESPVSGDYMNVATWLRTVAAPATAGFRNVRWSER
jgi:cellulose synthase operon protein YhjQ